MTAPLVVRTYAVRFGDAFLLKIPDHDANGPVTRHILIDVGNSYNGVGGDDAPFQPILEDVVRELDGSALDLYVMTHEHMDHVQGLLHAKVHHNIELDVDYAWLTASAAEDYYDRYPDAKKHFDLAKELYPAIERELQAAPDEFQKSFSGMLSINNPRRTADCVSYLRTLANHPPTYVYRGCSLDGAHPFRDVDFEIWAPEEDTSDYYGHFQPMRLDAAPGVAGSAGSAASAPLVPPPGVDAGTFYNLVRMRENGAYDNLLQIDKAKNNSSVVFALEWHGWRLLFCADAEVRSWRTMEREGVLSPVHFLKVSHHGSHNGTPDVDLLDQVLPEDNPDGWSRMAVVSTYRESYPGIPHPPTDAKLAARCELSNTLDMADGDYFDIEFEG